GDRADEILKAYSATTADEVYEAAAHLASARFVGFSTWKWSELHMKTGGKPVYRYLYARPRPAYLGMPGQPAPAPAESPAPRCGSMWNLTPNPKHTATAMSHWTRLPRGSNPEHV